MKGDYDEKVFCICIGNDPAAFPGSLRKARGKSGTGSELQSYG
jgi:hypothetical protein